MGAKPLFVLTILVALTAAAALAQDANQLATDTTLPDAPSAVMAQEQNAAQQNSSDLKGKQTK